MQRWILVGIAVTGALILLAAAWGSPEDLAANGHSPEESAERAVARAVAEEMRFVPIPAGRFLMGAPRNDDQAAPREFPRHEVVIERNFEVARFETTVGQFRRFCEATGYVTEAEKDPAGGWGFDLETGDVGPSPERTWRNPGFAQTDDHPVVQVSWIDAEAFCAWLTRREGRIYRLPTEAEWEYFCRAGTTTRFSFGDDPSNLADYANAADRSLRAAMPAADWASNWDDGDAFTAPVGGRQPNPWGLFDVHGNVWEWCADWHDDDGYGQMNGRKGFRNDAGVMRAIRGGGWYDAPHKHRASSRAWFKPVFRYCQLSGFRVVRDVAAD